MLQLSDIHLYQFKNYEQQRFQFTEKIIAISGNNGVGKTNLLDAIYLLCFTRSYFSKSDGSTVQRGVQGMRLEGSFVKNNELNTVTCIIRENNKKEFLLNKEDYKKFSTHIGRFPAVMIAPDDIELITGTSDIRRKYIDTLICQLDAAYLQQLIDYNKVLQQRNSLLKSGADRGFIDQGLFDILTNQLIKPGDYIYNRRKTFLSTYLPAVEQSYLQIAGSHEPVSLEYQSQLSEDSFENLLNAFRPKDLMLQRTTIGIHKDDIELKLNNENFKNIASQGQRKSLLFALKLREFDELKNTKGFPPILLLDDVFEKLDAGRLQNLLHHVCIENNGQVFITDTHKERLQKALQSMSIPFQMISL